MMKKRQAFVEKAAIALSEVREVEGKDTIQYDAMRDQDPVPSELQQSVAKLSADVSPRVGLLAPRSLDSP